MKDLGCNCHRIIPGPSRTNLGYTLTKSDLLACFRRETKNRYHISILPKEKIGIVMEFGGRVEFRWNLNEAVFWWSQNKVELCVNGVNIWSQL